MGERGKGREQGRRTVCVCGGERESVNVRGRKIERDRGENNRKRYIERAREG